MVNLHQHVTIQSRVKGGCIRRIGMFRNEIRFRYEPWHEKTRFLHMRKQRRRSAVEQLHSGSAPLFSLHR